jgi:N-acetylglucosamine kinase-like BadF-type ATPase
MEGAASNPNAVSFEQAVTNLTSLIGRLFAETDLKPEHCRGMCFGLAGVARKEEEERMANALLSFLHNYDMQVPLRVTNDAEIALMAGLGQNSGIIAIAGTGAIVFGFTPERKRFRTGGWGHILGDKGSGYEIGLQTLQTVMQSFDGVKPPTSLRERVLEKHGFSSEDELRVYVYQPFVKKQHIAEHAELCINAAREGDEAAIRIITGAADDMADLTIAMRSKDDWFAHSQIAVTGSIFRYSELFMDVYRNRLKAVWTEPRIVLSEQTPAYGAAMIALEEIQHR